ncbi:MAG: MFS transporter, partial [Candidatus Bathyarchaeia archaeon]
MEQTTKDFYVLTLSATLFHVSSQLVAPIFPLYLLSKGASTFEIGLIISLEPLFTIFSKFFLSFLIDRSGRWPIIATSMIGQSLSMLLYSVAPSLIWLYPIRVFQTVSLALFTPAAVSIIYDLSPSTKRGDFVGKYLTSYGTATMVGPLICSILSERSVEYRGILLSSAVFSFIGVVLLFTTIPLSRMRGSQGLREGLNAVSSGNTRMLKGLMLSREGLVLTYIRMAFSLADAFFTTIFALYVSEDLLYPTSTVALLFTVKGVTNTLFRIPSGMLTDRVGRVKPLLLAYGLL